jgi:CRP-like cAMP-binding protein
MPIETVPQWRRRAMPVLRRLSACGQINAAETQIVERLALQPERHKPGAVFAVEGPMARPRALLSGWACRQRLLPDGRRQIFDVLLPGDVLGLWDTLDTQTSVVALTPVETGDAGALRAAAEHPAAHPTLARFVAAAPALEQARLLDHVVRLGRASAYERVADLLWECAERQAAAGAGDERGFPFMATQETLADLLGLSVVHLNRVLQQLRREGLVELKSGRLKLLDPARVAALATSVHLPDAGRLSSAGL